MKPRVLSRMVSRVVLGPARWVRAHPHQLLTVAWLVGLLVVGTARAASADIIVGPDLAQGAPKTLYETYGFADYKLTVKPDEENSDWFGVSQVVLEVVGFINNLLLWACLGILYGGLSLLEWFLNLTLYRDAAPEIDTATQMIANRVFWPLIAATVAIAAFISYARWRNEGRGFLSDLGWVIAAGTLAVGFATAPSQLMNSVDSVRQDIATGVMSGSADYADTKGNPTGFPTPEITGDRQKASTRKLVDSVWSTFGATSWCFAEFRDLDVCKTAGYHALAGDEQWKQWMATLDNGGSPPEFREHTHWIRGQDMTRTGYLLVLALITIPMGLILLRLVIAGLVAVVGFLVMLVIGLVFLVGWPIPGWFRQTGTRYWVYTLGLQLQALFVTVVISAVMVVSTIIATLAGRYGFFIVALLNLGLFVAAMKARSWLELLTSVGGAAATGMMAVLLARSVTRGASQAADSTLGVAGKGLRGGGRLGSWISRHGPHWGSQPGATTTRWDTRGRTHPRMSHVEPVHATATRLRPPGTDVGFPRPTTMTPHASSTAHAGASTGASAQTPPAGHRHRYPWKEDAPEFPNRKFGDRKLRKNVAQAQEKTQRRGRVWVDKKGSGIAPLDPGPTQRERTSGYRIKRTSPPASRWHQHLNSPRQPGTSNTED